MKTRIVRVARSASSSRRRFSAPAPPPAPPPGCSAAAAAALPRYARSHARKASASSPPLGRSSAPPSAAAAETSRPSMARANCMVPCQVCVAAGMGMDPVCCTAACSISIEKTNSSRDGSGSPLSHAGAASALAWSRYISRYGGGSVSDARSIPAMRGNRASVSGFHNASPAETSALCQLWQTRSIAKAISPGPARAIATHISEGSLAITVSSSLMGVGVESVSVRERRRGRAAPFRKVWGLTPESEAPVFCEVR
eukprot:scaffold69065_cov75-Phaeocystis_antarctica.AAC.6